MWSGKVGGGGGVSGGRRALQLFSCVGPISTNRLCQQRDGTWGPVVVLKYRSMSGMRYQLGAIRGRLVVVAWGRNQDWGTWNWNDVDFPRLSPGRLCMPETRESRGGGGIGGEVSDFWCLARLFGSPGAHDFRVMGSRLRRATAASLLAVTPPPTQTHRLHRDWQDFF